MTTRIEHEWNTLQAEVKRRWGRLTDDDLTEIEGNLDKLQAAVARRYDIALDKAGESVNQFLEKATDAVEPTARATAE